MDNDSDNKPEEATSDTLGGRLVMLRGKKARGIIALELEVTVSTLMNWERNQTEPSASNIVKLCKHYGVSSDYLLGLSAQEIPEQTEQPAEPEPPSQPEQAVKPAEPENPPPTEQAVQPAEPEPPSQPEQTVQPAVPFCKDCPLVATVQSLSTAVTLALSRK